MLFVEELESKICFCDSIRSNFDDEEEKEVVEADLDDEEGEDEEDKDAGDIEIE